LDCRPPVARLTPRPGAGALEDRADALLERLGLAGDELRALEAEASVMVRQAERALRVALALLDEEGELVG
jgi:hypothetical protein